MMRSPGDATIETTLGELVAVVSEVAFETSDNAEEAYAIAAVVIADLLNTEVGDSFVGLKKFLH
ncbi:MAG TPA: hypothetical protein VI231_01965 [Candidatus Binatia bacterium]|jgi:hypothetical protein